MPVLGYLYYIGSKARVEIALSSELIETTTNIIAQCRQIAENNVIPPLSNNPHRSISFGILKSH